MFLLKIAALVGWVKGKLALAEGLLIRLSAAYLAARGYTEFVYSSFYYGSHSEYGEGNVERVFFFHPCVDLSCWVDKTFSHGHCSEDEVNTDFSGWLTYQEGLYIELPRGH